MLKIRPNRFALAMLLVFVGAMFLAPAAMARGTTRPGTILPPPPEVPPPPPPVGVSK
jgi:hypothetical protein